MLALVTWTVNGALGTGGARPTTNLSQTTGQHSSPPASGAASPSPAATASSTPAASPTGKPTPAPSSSAGHHAAGAKHPAAKKHPAKRGRKAAAASGACSGADLVLSLTSARYSYPAHAQPQFSVSVVSTARGRCTTDLGATHLHLLIRAGGKNTVWDSADCAGSAAPRATTLARGVPEVVRFSWNRKTSAPGCRAPHRAVRPGTYTATAYSGKLSSRTMIFVLRGRGIAIP